MELSQISALVSRLTDDQLVEEMQRPSGMAPLQIIMQEMQRRAALRGGKPRGFRDGGPVEQARASSIWDAIQAAGVPANMTSGYRTPQRQQELIAAGYPAARNSRHTSGRAVDFVLDGNMSREEVESRLRNQGLQYEDLIYHPENNSWHVEMPADWEPGQNVSGGVGPAGDQQQSAVTGFSTPQEITSNALGLGDMLARTIGVGEPVGSVNQSFEQMSAMVPGTGEAINSARKRYSEMEGQARSRNRGRALMEMGLAMAAAPTANFAQAVAAGGMAGLQARDRIAATEQGLATQTIQAEIAQAEAEQRRAMAILDAASGNRRADISARANAYGTGAQLAGQGAESRNAAARAELQVSEAEKDREFQANESRLNREAQSALANMEDRERRNLASMTPQQRRSFFYQRFVSDLSGRVGQELSRGRTYNTGDVYRDAEALAARAEALYAGASPRVGAAQNASSSVNSGQAQERPPLDSIFGR